MRRAATENAVKRLDLIDFDLLHPKDLDKLLPPGAVHQGVAVQAEPLEPIELEALIDGPAQRLAVLDQLADPHNLGAIFRSAAAFGVSGLILQTRHSPPITGIVAKSAAGAVETVAECRVVNIARALDALNDAGWTTIGLAGGGADKLSDALVDADKVALVLGAEGEGLRPAVAKACERLARIPIAADMESLNVSNAAAVAFYACSFGAF
ncbi:MAG: RNA methyltransferase [Pseudomonadota bacterium]